MRFVREKTIVQLTYLPKLFPVNCYLVEEKDSLTLVDAAMPNNAKAILQAAEQIGKPIARIVLTHAHADHIGAVDGLKALLPEARLFISGREARLLAGDVSLAAGEPDAPIRGGVPKPGAMASKPDELLQGGERIGSLLAVPAPGHTPGSMAFIDTRSDALIAGDAFQTRGGVAVAGQMKLLFPFPAMATWHKQTSIDTARKLSALKASLLATGHGEMAAHPQRLLDEAIANAERALAKAK
ncbi:MBL fold metallo-hydrolase [Paenibacillus sp. N4]|uniref:MBL fold metallo-hydrolase n=1 Tax=Paenibacillus vietnamensis TaxID=2590547 RepID=UPI001CD1875F|nr:MBL fold metallo-hydrolase [Paenibacillus vietnamensis]MCA0755633.1 MBL fold metallo-hydrolase [Paenibacillus vietnamensis]